MLSAYANAAIGLQVLLALAGLVLLWRKVVSPSALRAAKPSPLPRWEGEPVEFLLLILLVLFGTFLFAAIATSILRRTSVSGDAATVIAGAAAQFGMLAGVLTFASRSPGFRAHARLGAGALLKSGATTFVIALPILDGTAKVWQMLLQSFGIPPEPQDLIRMFANAKSPRLLIALVVLATIVAPVTEELVFRAGLFRFLRTRAPRFLALLVPALIFAALHVNWSTLEGFSSFAPLLVLALVFSLAYERTGNIGTTMIAHGLFNLNTILLIMCGLGS